jgi:hypothetical protein
VAISSGVGPHFASVNGWPVEHGTAEQTSQRQSGHFACTIPMGYPGAEDYWSNAPPGQASVVVSTRGDSQTLLTGELDTVTLNYFHRTIEVTGRDASAPLHANKSNEKWQNKTGQQIVQDLVGRVGLSMSGSGSSLMAGKLLEKDYVKLSDNVSFAQVIQKCAEFDGCRWWVKGNQLFYMPTGQGGSYTVNYVRPTAASYERGDFLDLRVTRNMQALKGVSVTVNSWHPKDKQTYTSKFEVPGLGQPLEYNYDLPNLKQDHVQQYAKSRAQEHARHGITVDAHLVGDPSIDVAMQLVLSGTGAFDGPYDMDSVTHQFGMHGHTMTIIARLPGEGGGAGAVGGQL